MSSEISVSFSVSIITSSMLPSVTLSVTVFSSDSVSTTVSFVEICTESSDSVAPIGGELPPQATVDNTIRKTNSSDIPLNILFFIKISLIYYKKV